MSQYSTDWKEKWILKDVVDRRRISDKNYLTSESIVKRKDSIPNNMSKSQYGNFEDLKSEKINLFQSTESNLFTRNTNPNLSEKIDTNKFTYNSQVYSRQISESASKLKNDSTDERREQVFNTNPSKKSVLNYNKEFSSTLSQTASKVTKNESEKVLKKNESVESVKNKDKPATPMTNHKITKQKSSLKGIKFHFN